MDAESRDEAALPIIVGGHNPQCMASDVSSLVASFMSLGTLIVGGCAAVMGTVLAKLSDRVGRVKVITANTTGLILSEIVLLLVAMAPASLSYRWLYVAYAVDGLRCELSPEPSLWSAAD